MKRLRFPKGIGGLTQLTLNKHNNWVDSLGKVATRLQIVGKPITIEETTPPDMYKGKEETMAQEISSWAGQVIAGKDLRPNAYLLLQDFKEEHGQEVTDGSIGDQWEREDGIKYSFAFLMAVRFPDSRRYM